MNNTEKEELIAIRDNCYEKFIGLINTTTKSDVRTYCINISSTEDLRYISEYGKTSKIAEEAWEILKTKANNEDLKNLSKHGRTSNIVEEARRMYNKLHPNCTDITKFI